MTQTIAKVSSGGSSAHAKGLAIVRILLGVFFVFEALGKHEWLWNSAILNARLDGWANQATPAAHWYLEHVARPGVVYFARLVPLGELAAGLALLVGFATRLAALLAFLMVLNFHVAGSTLFRYSFLTNGYGLPVLSGLLGLAVGGARLPWRVGR